MPKVSTVFRRLAALGLSAEQTAGVLEILDEMDEERNSEIMARKAACAARVAKYRAKSKPVTLPNVTSRDVTTHAGVTRVEDNLLTKEITGQKESKKVLEARGTRLPDDWAPLREESIPDEIARGECAKFRDYWHSKAGAMARKTDWQATWRNWCRKAIADQQNRRPTKRNYVDAAMDMVARGEIADAYEESPWGNRTNVELLPTGRQEHRPQLEDLRNGSGRGLGGRNH